MATLTLSDIYTSDSRQLPTSNSELPREPFGPRRERPTSLLALHPVVRMALRELGVGSREFGRHGTTPPRPPRPCGASTFSTPVHHAPVARERADVWILPRLGRRLELHRDRLARLDQLRREQHLLQSAARIAAPDRSASARDRRRPAPIALSESGLTEHEVVLHRVRVGEDDLDQLARRDGQLGLVELHLLRT